MIPRSVSSLLAIALLCAVPATTRGKPRHGDRELRLGASTPVFIVGPAAPSGLTRVESGGGGSTLFDLDLGVGWFVTNHLELGGLATIAYASAPSETLVGFAPLLKFLYVPHSVGLYVEAAPGFLIEKKIDTHALFHLSTGLGMEAFLTEWWAIHAGPTYELYLNKGGYQTLHVLGVSWGIAAYF
jgi:hypothetical protein